MPRSRSSTKKPGFGFRGRLSPLLSLQGIALTSSRFWRIKEVFYFTALLAGIQTMAGFRRNQRLGSKL
jgi:hypothetical protein